MEDILKRQNKIKKIINKRIEGIIVLEDVHDPHNVQAVVRTAEGLGFGKIGLIFDKEKPFDPKNLGKTSSSSANKWVEYEIFDSNKKAFEELKKRGYEIVVSMLDKKAESVYKSELRTKKIALVMGNEHRGVSKTAIKMADRKVYIPMEGMVQSFNISVAAGILMYEIKRQREKAGIEKYRLEKEGKEKLKKKIIWQ